MKIIKYLYIILSLGLIFFLGRNYYEYQFNKKVIYADKSKEELILYFNDICLGGEYGATKRVTKKWKTPLNLYIVKDKKYNEQIDYLSESIDKINKLITDNFKILISKDSANANGYLFLCSDKKIKNYPEPFGKKFNKINENYYGFFNYDFYKNSIYRASIFINTSKPIEFQKSAILEELVQSLGFGNDSFLYPNSIFYQDKYKEGKPILGLSELDKKLIKLLYNSHMKVGLNRLETDKLIRELIDKEQNNYE